MAAVASACWAFLVGALIVIVVGGGILFATGMIGGDSSSTNVKVELPKMDMPDKK